MRELMAGATGAIGRQLIPQLVAAGHQVSATTRTAAKLGALRAAGADALVLDGLDATAVGAAVARTEPAVIVHPRPVAAMRPSKPRYGHGSSVTVSGDSGEAGARHVKPRGRAS